MRGSYRSGTGKPLLLVLLDGGNWGHVCCRLGDSDDVDRPVLEV